MTQLTPILLTSHYLYTPSRTINILALALWLMFTIDSPSALCFTLLPLYLPYISKFWVLGYLLSITLSTGKVDLIYSIVPKTIYMYLLLYEKQVNVLHLATEVF